MDDTMSKETAAELLDNLVGMVSDTQDNNYDLALKMGIEALRADAVTVIRCEQCMHYNSIDFHCYYHGSMCFKPNDYCPYGRVRDNG